MNPLIVAEGISAGSQLLGAKKGSDAAKEAAAQQRIAPDRHARGVGAKQMRSVDHGEAAVAPGIVLTPMMAAYLLKATPPEEESPGWLMPKYLATVRYCLHHRWATLGGTGVFFIGSLMLIPLLPQGFIPADDNPQTQVFVELPPGSTLEQTRASAERARCVRNESPASQAASETDSRRDRRGISPAEARR